MYYVYILQSQKSGRYYIGSTNNVERRLLEHNSGQTRSLLNHRPLIVVFRKGYLTNLEARRCELRLKKLKSRVILDRIVKEGVLYLKV